MAYLAITIFCLVLTAYAALSLLYSPLRIRFRLRPQIAAAIGMDERTNFLFSQRVGVILALLTGIPALALGSFSAMKWNSFQQKEQQLSERREEHRLERLEKLRTVFSTARPSEVVVGTVPRITLNAPKQKRVEAFLRELGQSLSAENLPALDYPPSVSDSMMKATLAVKKGDHKRMEVYFDFRRERLIARGILRSSDLTAVNIPSPLQEQFAKLGTLSPKLAQK